MRKFVDDEHFKAYENYLKKSNTDKDLYRKSLFYILSSLEKFRENINKIYDFQKQGAYTNVFDEILLSDSERELLKLSFHLYNSKNKFDLNSAFSNFEPQRQLIALNAIQIRYNGDLLYKMGDKTINEK